MEQYRRIKAIISLDAVEHNFKAMKEKLAPGTQMVAVVKADGYGHGAEAIAHLIEGYDYIWGFAVASPEEAFLLRDSGIIKPILILGVVFSEFYSECASRDIRIPIMDPDDAREFADAAKKAGHIAKVHIPVDTGMTRIGLAVSENSADAAAKIAGIPGLLVEGIFTHFARADETDRSPALVQLERFHRFISLLKDRGIEIPLIHASNSAGIMRVPEAHFNLVRAGISIYGIYPSDEVEKSDMPLEPAMSLVSHVTYVKDVPAGTEISYGGTFTTERLTRLATVPVGYADGYPRQLSGKAHVLIGGKPAPVCGRVCMDQMMVDVTDIPGVKRGDRVVLMGRDGENEITVDTLGNLSGRFPYEFVCCINKRVPRIYIHNGEEQI